MFEKQYCDEHIHPEIQKKINNIYNNFQEDININPKILDKENNRF